MFGRKDSPASAKADRLHDTVASHLDGADEETVQIVTAIAGLLALVACADRHVSAEEVTQIRAELERIHGLDRRSVDAIVGVLVQEAWTISSTRSQRYTRYLREHGDRELRREVLQALVDLAAADGQVDTEEVTELRRLAAALGLTQADYNEAQKRHRDKLTILG